MDDETSATGYKTNRAMTNYCWRPEQLITPYPPSLAADGSPFWFYIPWAGDTGTYNTITTYNVPDAGEHEDRLGLGVQDVSEPDVFYSNFLTGGIQTLYSSNAASFAPVGFNNQVVRPAGLFQFPEYPPPLPTSDILRQWRGTDLQH